MSSKHERGQQKIDLDKLSSEEIKERYENIIMKRRERQRSNYKKLKENPELKKEIDEKRKAYQREYYARHKDKFKQRNAENRAKAKLKKQEKLKNEISN